MATTYYGTASDDRQPIAVPKSSLTWDGLKGIDTAVIQANKSDFKISTSQDKKTFEVKVAVHVISGASSPPTINLKHVEFIEFSDFTVQLLTLTDDGSGNYTASGTSGNDSITTGTGNDTITASAGGDKISAGGGNNTVDAGAGNDTITAGASTDTAANTEQITGGAGKDTITVKGLATSTIYGDGATDTGADGNDTIKAGDGNEHIYGGGGKDNISTGKGDDHLYGGLGQDTLTGGAGIDTFHFDTALDTTNPANPTKPGAADNIDVITDFQSGTDIIELSHTIFAALNVGALNAADFVSEPGAVAHDSTDRIMYDSKSGALYYDADGNGSGTAIEFAILKGHPTLAASDIHIV